MFILWLYVMALAPSGLTPEVIVDDTLLTSGGLAIERPNIAIYWNGDIYIGDRNAELMFVRHKDGSLVTMGRPGRGPGEFANFPDHLLVREGRLVIEEWNRWREYLYDDAQKFISSRRLERFVYEYHGSQYRKLVAEEAIKTGFLYEKVGSGKYVCRLERRDYEGVHLTRGYLKEGPNGTVVAFKKGGRIEVYDRDCRLLHRMVLPMEVYKTKMVADQFSTKISLAAGQSGQAYQGGTPLIDGAVESLSRIWVLGKNENEEHRHFLLEVDVIQGTVLGKTDLDQPYTRITWHQGVLALASPETSIVTTFKTQ